MNKIGLTRAVGIRGRLLLIWMTFYISFKACASFSLKKPAQLQSWRELGTNSRFSRCFHTKTKVNKREKMKAATAMAASEIDDVISSIALPPNTVIILAGATSVGKSAVSMELSKRFPSEIIIADSVQIYKGLDIGANKPTLEEQAMVPHHLVNVAETREAWNTADFCHRAVEAIQDILSRKKTPIIVGGSTMWIQWLVHGIPDAPKASEEALRRSRELIDKVEARGDWSSALEILRAFDPSRSEKIDKNDWYRLRRYLEIAVDLSLLQQHGAAQKTLTGQRTKLLTADQYDLRCFFLFEEREELYPIIDERCEQMLDAGLFAETFDLVLRDQLRPTDTIIKSIGYRQALEYFCDYDISLATNTTVAPPIASAQRFDSFLKFLRDFSTATRNYAKRQISWYRKDLNFLFIKIFRDLLHKETFRSSYQQVTKELLHHLQLPRSDYQDLLQRQLQLTSYYLKLQKLRNIPLPFSCENDLERDVLLHLADRNLVNLKPSKIQESDGIAAKEATCQLTTPSSSSVITDELWQVRASRRQENTSKSPPRQAKGNKNKSTRPSYSPDSGSGGGRWTALDCDIRASETKQMRYFASKFQGMTVDWLAKNEFYSKLVSQCEDYRHRLWSINPALMEEFKRRLLEENNSEAEQLR